MQTYVCAAPLLTYISTFSLTTPSCLCNWMQWDFFSSERHWRKFDMHSFKARHSFLSASLGLRVGYPWAGLSDYFYLCSCNLFSFFSFSPLGASVNVFSIPFSVSVFGLTGRFQSGKLKWSQTFTGCFLPVIRDLFYESDLTQWSFFMPMRRRHWTIRMFNSTLLFALWIFHVFWPCMWILKRDTKKNSVKKRTSLVLSVCERERRTHAQFCNSLVLV